MGTSAALKIQDSNSLLTAVSNERLKILHEIIDKESLMLGDFTLSSGRKSTFLFQLRQTTLHPEAASLLGEIIVDFMRQQNLRCIGGLLIGAAPIVSAAVVESHHKGYPISAFYVRKEPKVHGAKELIDGHIDEGGDVLVVDDVTTTGASTLRAVEAIRERNCIVKKAFSIVDREEGATELLRDDGIELTSLFSKSDFGIH